MSQAEYPFNESVVMPLTPAEQRAQEVCAESLMAYDGYQGAFAFGTPGGQMFRSPGKPVSCPTRLPIARERGISQATLYEYSRA
jgi:hypothetical protein